MSIATTDLQSSGSSPNLDPYDLDRDSSPDSFDSDNLSLHSIAVSPLCINTLALEKREIQALTRDDISSLSHKDIQRLEEEVQHFTPEQMKFFSEKQLSAFTEEQVKALTYKQIKSLYKRRLVDVENYPLEARISEAETRNMFKKAMKSSSYLSHRITNRILMSFPPNDRHIQGKGYLRFVKGVGITCSALTGVGIIHDGVVYAKRALTSKKQ